MQEMNLYALLPLTAFFANVILGFYVLYRNPKEQLNRLYSLFAFSWAIWALGDFLVFTANTSQAALYMSRLATFGASLAPAFVLHFFLVFTKNKFIARKRYYMPLYLPSLFFIYVNFATDLISVSAASSWWGYNIVRGILYIPFTFYITGYIIVGILSCWKFYSKSIFAKEKTHAKLLIIAVTVPLIGGIATQIIPIIFGYMMIPLTSTLTIFSTVVIAYAVIKYKLMAPLSFNIQRKLTATILLLIIIISMVTISVVGNSSRAIIEQQIYERLETTAQSRAHQVNTFLNAEKEAITQLSKSVVIERLLLAGKDEPDFIKKHNDVIRRLKDTPRVKEYAYDIFVLDENGTVVASSEEKDIGRNKSNKNYFLEGMENAFISDAYMAKDYNKNIIAFSAPVSDEKGTVLGVVVIRISMNELNKITTDRTGLGETGEIYIINKEGYMITPSRFINDTSLKQKVDTENAGNCFGDIEKYGTQEHGHDVALSQNYQGTPVLGVHAHIYEMNWCLLAEMSEEEALAPVARLTNTLLMVFAVFFALGIIFSGLLSRTITKPIIKLCRGAEEIERGNLDYKVGTEAGDEIGDLSRAFDRMTAKLKKSHEELEQKVCERTEDLNTKVDLVRKSRAAALNIMEDLEEEHTKILMSEETLKETVLALKKTQSEMHLMNMKLRNVNRKLVNADNMKAEFMSVASHELKTPITSILGFSELLQNDAVMNNLEQRKKFLGIIVEESKHISGLISDILDMTRIDTGTLKFVIEKLNLNDIVREVKEDMSVILRKKDISLKMKLEDVPEMEGDRKRLKQILINLINNAYKFTPEGGSITLHTSKEGSRICCAITDTGKGIPKKFLKLVFGRFFQIDGSGTRAAGGVGLGLAITKGIVEAHGGKIKVESKVGKGTTFYIYLPLKLKKNPEKMFGDAFKS